MAKVLAAFSLVALTVLAGFGLFRSGVIDGLQGKATGEYLIITNSMYDAFVPGNLRARDLALTLRANGNNVVIISRDGPFAPEFVDTFARAGVETHSPTQEALFFTDTLLETRHFDAAFLYLWFWGDNENVPSMYIPSIRALSPSTKIVILTDDAHTERKHRLDVVNSALQTPVTIGDELLDNEEVSYYAEADLVLAASEADANTITQQLADLSVSVPVRTLHFTHNLASVPVPASLKSLPSLSSRSGLVFVGYGRNPSNQVGLQWFFENVYPELAHFRLDKEKIYLVGRPPADNYASLRAVAPQANLVPVSRAEPEQLREILGKGRVLIAPVFSTGITTKVLLGLESGLPVVTTSMAAEGLRWNGHLDESALLVANDGIGFASAIEMLLTDDQAWTQVADAGLKLAASQINSKQFSMDVASVLATLSEPTTQKAEEPVYTTLLTTEVVRKARSREAPKSSMQDWIVMSGSGSSQCPAGQFQNSQNMCQCNLGTYKVGANCVGPDQCLSGTYPDSTTGLCQSCAMNCNRCTSATVCTSCSSGFFLQVGMCSDMCSDGTSPKNGVCAPPAQQNAVQFSVTISSLSNNLTNWLSSDPVGFQTEVASEVASALNWPKQDILVTITPSSGSQAARFHTMSTSYIVTVTILPDQSGTPPSPTTVTNTFKNTASNSSALYSAVVFGTATVSAPTVSTVTVPLCGNTYSTSCGSPSSSSSTPLRKEGWFIAVMVIISVIGAGILYAIYYFVIRPLGVFQKPAVVLEPYEDTSLNPHDAAPVSYSAGDTQAPLTTGTSGAQPAGGTEMATIKPAGEVTIHVP